ncbi:DUF6282 family protein [Chloroflexota bacterium]
MSVVEKLLQGSIDIHIHHAPDPRVKRKSDALQVALEAKEAGMRAIVLKSHEYPTVPLAYTVSQMVPDIIIVGSICLNSECGGLNARALEASAKMGAKVAWMPTFSAANHLKASGRAEEGITILDKEGKLLPVVNDILDIVKSYRMVLATGHISISEGFALVEEATQRGLPKIVLTHPLWRGAKTFSLEEQRLMVEKGVIIEHCFSHTLPHMGELDPVKIIEAARTVGVEQCILSTDLGQAFNPTPAEGMRMTIATLLELGLTEKEMELMVKLNPAKLLDLG